MAGDFADNWCSLYELFVSVSGLKLRLNIPDTAIIKDGRIIGWYYTNRDGVASRCSLHEISRQALYQKLTTHQTIDVSANPNSYVAVVHYESGVSRPLRQQELQHLMTQIVGPYEVPVTFVEAGLELPFCIQAYVVPVNDMRYLTTYGGPDQGACTTFGRRYSMRYTHAMDDPSNLQDVVAQAVANTDSRGGLQGRGPAQVIDGDEPSTLTAEEMLVESQLVAMGILEPRETMTLSPGPGDADPWGNETGLGLEDTGLLTVSPNQALPVGARVKQEVNRLVQGLVSFIERSHGLRIQGLVAEFIRAHRDVLVLIAVHAVQWDARSSRGRLGTFTDRWNDFTQGAGPPPAPRPVSKRHHTPTLLRSADQSTLVMSERASGPGAVVGLALPGSVALPSGGAGVMSMHYSGRGAPYGASSSQFDGDLHLSAARPGSAPAMVLHRFNPHTSNSAARPTTAVPFSGSRNGGYTMRNAVATARRGAGGNPTASPPTPDSYVLWTSRDALPTDTIAGSLTLELEVLKERLQRQVDISARAEAALTQLAVSSQATQTSLLKRVEELEGAVVAAKSGTEELEEDYERLRAERASVKAEVSALQEELRATREQLAQDRATLATTVRGAQSKEESLEDLVARLKAENEALATQNAMLARRCDEEAEVVEAARAQLYDYRQMVTTLQGQLRRGKNKPGLGPAPSAGPGAVTDLKASLASLAPGMLAALVPAPAAAASGGRTTTFIGGGGAPKDDYGADVAAGLDPLSESGASGGSPSLMAAAAAKAKRGSNPAGAGASPRVSSASPAGKAGLQAQAAQLSHMRRYNA